MSTVGLNILYAKYRRRAGSKGLEFELTKEQFEKITSRRCRYCAAAPTKSIRGYTYNGIDRIDSARGYTTDNSAPCCWTCNSMKASHSIEELTAHVLQFLRHFYRRR